MMVQGYAKWVSPSRWERAPFEMVLHKVGHQRKIKQRDYLTSGNIPVIDQGEVFIGGYTNDEAAIVALPPPFVIFGDHTRQIKLVSFRFAPGAEGVIILKPEPGIETKLAYYFLQALVHFIPDNGYARHFQFLRKLEFPVPPLVEQRAIVAKIEELFSELDKGIEQLQAVKQQLKQYRQAVLKAAFEGKLTAKWRSEQQAAGNLPDADELLEQIKKAREERYQQQLQEWKQAVAEWEAAGGKESGRRKPMRPSKLKSIPAPAQAEMPFAYTMPRGWCWIRVGDLTLGVEYGTSKKSSDEGRYPVLRMGNIQDCRFDWTDLVFSNDVEEFAKYKLRMNDVLFNRTNSPELVGKTAVFKGEREALFAGYLIRINQIDSIVDADYLNFYLNSVFARQYGSKVKTDGVNQSNINGTKLVAYPFPYCCMDEQRAIVSEVESRFSVLEVLDRAIDEGLRQAETLSQSILKKAFEGRLLNEAELAAVRNDPEYEPADKLLKRIQAKRGEDMQPSRTRRTRITTRRKTVRRYGEDIEKTVNEAR
ncbi:MAG TPA: restriction endonuclease [Firmicutes bacterium]|nr:restriction endonuclease [Bacillota bacterium]